jgi:hypothetical protein
VLYNQINGTFACNNSDVLHELRSWGFSGDITPDAVFALHDPLLAVNAGVDHLGFGVSFKALYDSGKMDEQTVDRVLFHTILPIFKVDVFDHPPTGVPSARVSTPDHVAHSDRIIESASETNLPGVKVAEESAASNKLTFGLRTWRLNTLEIL